MHARSRSTLRILLAAGLAIGAVGRPVHAQQSLAPRTPPADVAPTRASTGPTMDAASVAVRKTVSQETSMNPAMMQRRAGYGRPVALMVVGGAGVLAGLIIGGGAGTAIAVGGAVVGLYGLYEFLQ